MKRLKGIVWKASTGFLAVLFVAGVFRDGLAQGVIGRPATHVPSYELNNKGHSLRLSVGKSLIISVPYTIRRISVGAPKVADVATISGHQFMVSAKAPGVTNLIVWDEGDQQSIFNLLVQADVEALAQGIKELFPEESLTVRAIKDTIVVSGVTARADVRESVGQIAEAFGQKKVVNMVRVDQPPIQIALKVRMAEVARTAIRELGLSFIGGKEPGQAGVFPGVPFVSPFGEFRDSSGPDLSFDNLVNFFISDTQRKLGFFLRALEQRGDLRTLAEPRLVTRSGQKASFLAGGEFPVPVPQAGAGAAVTIEFKPFGVRLDFTPKVLGKDRIELTLAPEVSELDFTNAVSVGGISVPSLTKRRTETVVELKDGQTFAVAGLIQNRLVKDLSRFPFIGEIPILGLLFTSDRFNRQETELLVLITPEIVKTPAADDPMPLPGGASLGRGL